VPRRLVPDHFTALPLDAIVLGASALMVGGLAVRAARVLRELALREPAPSYTSTRSTSMP
jgi:hypothetical protein